MSNLIGTKSLLESFAVPPRRFIFSSTIDVYAPMSATSLLSESAALGAANVYASSKLCCERIVAAWGAQMKTDVTILRYGACVWTG